MEDASVTGLTPMERTSSASDDIELETPAKLPEEEEGGKKEEEEDDEEKQLQSTPLHAESDSKEEEEEEEKGEEPSPTPNLSIPVYHKPQGYQRFMNKGDLSNCVTFVIMILGIVLNAYVPNNTAIQYILAFGLFGFAGGFTNWLAVKMLFDRVPFLIGSGVIPRQFKAIRNTVKNTIMKTFFDQQYLGRYIDEHAPRMLEQLNLPDKLTTLLNDPAFIQQLSQRLVALSQKPEGMMLMTIGNMFGGVPNMVTMMQPMLANMGKELVGGFLENLTRPHENGGDNNSSSSHGTLGSMVNVEELREQIDRLMTEKLEELTPEVVKGLMEEVIREHLGWLIVWGNVFGGLIGVISLGAGYGSS